jgi:hypothetical protein
MANRSQTAERGSVRFHPQSVWQDEVCEAEHFDDSTSPRPPHGAPQSRRQAESRLRVPARRQCQQAGALHDEHFRYTISGTRCSRGLGNPVPTHSPFRRRPGIRASHVSTLCSSHAQPSRGLLLKAGELQRRQDGTRGGSRSSGASGDSWCGDNASDFGRSGRRRWRDSAAFYCRLGTESGTRQTSPSYTTPAKSFRISKPTSGLEPLTC